MTRRHAVVCALAAAALAAWLWRHHAGDRAAAHVAPGRAYGTRPALPEHTLPRATIAGTVTDDAHRGVAHARVCADLRSREISQQRTREPRCTTADAQGRYVLTGLHTGEYRVAASRKPFRPGVFRRPGDRGESWLLLASGGRELGVDIVLRAGGVEITGTVSDVTGGPIAHASVNADSGQVGAAFTPSVESDDDGRFSLWVQPGETRVTAQAPGYASGSDDGNAPGTFEILLTPESTLSGTVVDAKTGEPVSGVPVTVETASDITDEHGAFQIAALEPGRYVASVHTPHGYGRSEGSTLVGLGQHVDGIVIRIHPAAALSGTILLPDKTPCKHSSGSLTDAHAGTPALLERAADGTLHADGVLPGNYRVSVRCAGYVSRDRYPAIELRDKDRHGLVWEVEAGATIKGRVSSKLGTPIADAYVSARTIGGAARANQGWGSDTSSADGSFVLGGLTPGRYRIDVSAAVHDGPKDGWMIDVGPAATVTKDLVLDDGGSIRGVVVDAHGKPVAAARVVASGADDGSVRTNVDGAFALDGLHPGAYRVRARDLREPGSTDDDTQGEKVTVVAGKAATVRLVVEAQAGVIEGTVRDASGKPVSDAFVSAARESDAAGALGSNALATRWSWDEKPVVSNLDGKFKLRKLSPGTYTLRAYRKGGGEAVAEHVPVGGIAKLQIRATGVIEGTVWGGTIDELQIALVDTRTGLDRRETFFRTDGRYVIRDLPPGTFTLTASTSRGKKQLVVALGEGEHKTGIDLALDELVTLTGRVVDVVTRQPVHGMHMVAQAGTRNRNITIDAEDDDRAYISDEAGRFALARAPRGAITIYGFDAGGDDGRYGDLETTRQVAGTATTDLGDMLAVKKRLSRGQVPGVLGIRFAEVSPDTAVDEQTFKISYIDPKGPAANRGLEVGDVVTTIDGIDVSGANHTIGGTLLRAPPGTVLQLGVARGATVNVALAAQ